MDYNLCPRPIFQVHLKRYIPTGFDLKSITCGAREFYLIL